MTICPIAIAVGCRKCPAFSVCPLKSLLGDAPKDDGKGGSAAREAPKAKSRK